eukprot:gene8083-12428_t
MSQEQEEEQELTQEEEALDESAPPKPELAHENLLLNELIREYLEHAGYQHTANTLVLESGQPTDKLPRDMLARQLKIAAPHPDLPLLFSAVRLTDSS